MGDIADLVIGDIIDPKDTYEYREDPIYQERDNMKNTFEIENAFCKHETEKALLIVAAGLDGETWIPKSQIHDDSEVWGADEKKNLGTLVINEWFAIKLGLV